MAKSKTQPHALTEENMEEFVGKLHRLLRRYKAHVNGSPISLETSNLTFRAEGIEKCRPECIRKVRSCDLNGNNCRIDLFCDC